MHVAQALYYTEPEQHPTQTPQPLNSVWASLFKSLHYHIELRCLSKEQDFHLQGTVTRYFGETVPMGLINLKSEQHLSIRHALTELGTFEFAIKNPKRYSLELLLPKEGVLIPNVRIGLEDRAYAESC